VSPGSLIIVVVLLGLFWFLLVRPQRAGVRRQQALLASLQPGDEIVSAGGLYGTIRSLEEDDLEVEIADGLIVRMARGAVAGIVEADEPDETDVQSSVDPPNHS
jgi:preprotein translocase subunit YajC